MVKTADTRKNGGGGRDESVGGIPRPHVTSSPSKLAVRTNTKLLSAAPPNNNKHDAVGRTVSSGGENPRPDSSNPRSENSARLGEGYRYGGGSGLAYAKPPAGGSAASQKALVSDKLYPRYFFLFQK